MNKYFLSFSLAILFTLQLSAQDWWTKTREEAIPADLTGTMLLVERFKTMNPEEAPEQAYLDGKKGDHPLIKKTNDHLEEYNKELKEVFKAYKYNYKVVSKKKSEDTELYPLDTVKYVLKHVVYLRKYMEAGNTTHFYTYLYYFHDRATGKDYPYIYLFEEKDLQGLEKLIGYLNKL